ncbi:hypothetical protein JTE90_028749 [Oedothorax gibbosus]|uniref:acid phosphatase n=1 Tax=Oedothorax gibbosus TaxID=931172 RepID=A0AAV6UFG4_9ARAC|nr:hypothetical protein JTE90_028749 [Oedothorax gibbosus]
MNGLFVKFHLVLLINWSRNSSSITTVSMLAAAWIAAAAVSCAFAQDTELLLVQMIYRHGARAPIIPYPTDPNPPESWPEGFGTLTKLGKRQHYVLGTFLRSFYSGFVTSDPKELMVNSTEYDRCIRSALSNLASFYAPTEEWTIEEGLAWQPIAVYYKDSASDRYLAMGSKCPKFFEIQDQRFNSTEFMNVVESHREMIEAVMYHGGVPDWQWACLLQDTVLAEKVHGLIVPEWLDPWWEELTELTEFAFFWLFNTPQQKRIRAGPILGKFIENMDNKIAGINDQIKVHMYSAHDANLVALLEALDLYERRPPFSACLLVELHELLDGEKAIRLLYLNSSTPEDINTIHPNILKLQGCGEFCPLEDFRQLTKHLIPEDWDKECQTTNELYNNEAESLSRLFGSHEFMDNKMPTTTGGTTCGPSTGSNEMIDCSVDTE